MSKQPKKLPKRSEINIEHTWRLEDIFETDDVWEGELANLKEAIPIVASFKGQLASSSDTLLEALQTQDKLSERIGKLYTYAHMRHDQDTNNPTYQSQEARAISLYSDYGNLLSFMTPEILAIGSEKIEEFINENENLQLYRQSLEEITNLAAHVLNENEEKLIAQLSEVTNTGSNTFGMLNNADLTFPTITDDSGQLVEITHGNYIRFLENTNQAVREKAFKAVYKTYGSLKNTFASTLAGQVKKNNAIANIRHFKTARGRALTSNHIPEVVYDQLIETINEHLPLLHRYNRLRKSVLGLKELHLYDMYTPLIPETKVKFTYEESASLVKESLTILGEEYLAVIKEGFQERWVDVYENEGKRSGAYSSGTYGTAPYILMNWQDNVSNLFTLTHEFGHSVHSYFSRKYQPFVYSDYSIFVAEVASTCNEALLNHHLLKQTTDKNQRLFLLNNFLEGFRGTVFRQTMFAEFEQFIHEKDQEGVPLTADALSTWYFELNKKYFGEDVHVDEEIAMEWARIPHFYYNFYVYQYATGYAAAFALSQKILTEGQPAADCYINEFLKAGSSDYPLEVLKKAGVDMRKKQPIIDAMKIFEQTLNEMEALLA